MVAPASDDQKTDRTLAQLADGRVKDRRPVELPVVSVGGLVALDDRVDDRRLALVEGSSRERHEGLTLQKASRDLGCRDRLQAAAAQEAEHPAVVVEGAKGQSQTAPGLLAV